jgi:flavin reductase (DIM6/NTAB) family NADH-FMN oxidoreductase RutF
MRQPISIIGKQEFGMQEFSMREFGMQEDGKFVSINTVDNFYQASAFIPMSFALVTTVHESGETGIGPHALLYPFSITKPHSMMLISRNNSGTAHNIRRNRKCALNYILFDRNCLKGIAAMGYPGLPMADKIKANPYTLVDSPSPEKAADPDCPQIISEAYQVFECTWDDSFDLHSKSDALGNPYDGHFNLLIDHLFMKEKYVPGIEKGEVFPNMPIFQGFRANRGFWFSKHHRPFSVPLPKVKGREPKDMFYRANRIDPNVRFTIEACKQLVQIPKPFLDNALKGIIARAIEEGVAEVDEAFVEKIAAER